MIGRIAVRKKEASFSLMINGVPTRALEPFSDPAEIFAAPAARVSGTDRPRFFGHGWHG